MKDIGTIHTFGDSHCACLNLGPNVRAHHLGPILCYSFGQDPLGRCDIRKPSAYGAQVKNGDTVIFYFGEIDCRCHIHKHATGDVSYKNIIKDIVDNYIKAIKITTETSKLELKNICIFNVVPTVEKHTVSQSSSFPLLGEDEERKKYVLYFNSLLKTKCADNNFIFFDVYDKYTDKNGFLNKELSDGNVHIGDKENKRKYVMDFINKNLQL